jgi:hypothetical protein
VLHSRREREQSLIISVRSHHHQANRRLPMRMAGETDSAKVEEIRDGCITKQEQV